MLPLSESLIQIHCEEAFKITLKIVFFKIVEYREATEKLVMF